MSGPRSQPVSIPSAQAFQAYLSRWPPKGPSPLARWWRPIGLGAALALALLVPEGPMMLLPWLILGMLVLSSALIRRNLGQLERQTGQIQEWAMLGQSEPALREGWRLLPRTCPWPELHHRLVAAVTYALEQLGAFEAAVVGYQHLLEQIPPEYRLHGLLCTRLALAQLAADHLTDADQTLSRLRELERGKPEGVLSAAYYWARLYQLVHGGHDSEAIALRENLIERLRPLGVEAGFGYALMALACWRRARREGDPATEEMLQQARHWWERATLLLSVDRLVRKHTELSCLAQDPLMQEVARTTQPPWAKPSP